MAGINLPTRSLVSQQEAAVLKKPEVPRSKFFNTWTRKTTFDAGYLIPFLVDEILPGDHMEYDMTAYVRMATPLFPMFDNQKIDTHFFFVPMRIVWSNFKKFMGEQIVPGDSTAFTIPQIVSPAGGFAAHSLYDHFGLPTALTAGQTISINALIPRCYNAIYNEWYRDENLIPSAFISAGDGPDGSGSYILQRRGKSHDYFTSCLPFAQKGNAATIPLQGQAPIVGMGFQSANATVGPVNVTETGGGVVAYGFYQDTATVARVAFRAQAAAGAVPQIFANLDATSVSVSINSLRNAWAIQSMLERDARGGTRYTEKVRAVFGVVSPDMRLQRPEYIGGGSSSLNITPIAQTAPTAGVPLGALGAAGTAAGAHRASYAATEHGYIIGIMSVRSELSYAQGLHKMWTRSTLYDFYDPLLAGLGEQPVLLQELYCTGTDAADTTVFGYQERFHEYRTRVSEVTGAFRPQAAGTLAAWHLGQNFTAPPTLGKTFIEDTPPMDRVLAAGALSLNQQYLADLEIRRTAIRPVPMYGTPSTLGRF